VTVYSQKVQADVTNLMDCDSAKLPPIGRWSRPGFVSRVFGARKAEDFAIDRKPNDDIPIPLQLGNGQLVWQDGRWNNCNFDVQPMCHSLAPQEQAAVERENAELQIECEILLHLLTVSEMNKSRLQKELDSLRENIAESLQEIDSDSSS
jgi:hypothetical protein